MHFTTRFRTSLGQALCSSIIICIFHLCTSSVYAQDIYDNKIIKQLHALDYTKIDTQNNGKQQNKMLDIYLLLSEHTFHNWQAGGLNSVSATLTLGWFRAYRRSFGLRDSLVTQFSLSAQYGITQQEGTILQKTKDEFDFSVDVGYKTNALSNIFANAQFRFRTQFAQGFNYTTSPPDRTSTLLAPAYITFGLGVKAEFDPYASLYFSPVTLKSTLVLDDRLSEIGAFGVNKNESVRNEVGMLFTGFSKFEAFKNITLENLVVLYTDYLDNFVAAIDVQWRSRVDMKVNEIVKVNAGFELFYDENTTIEVGKTNEGQPIVEPRVQFTQNLSVGIGVSL